MAINLRKITNFIGITSKKEVQYIEGNRTDDSPIPEQYGGKPLALGSAVLNTTTGLTEYVNSGECNAQLQANFIDVNTKKEVAVFLINWLSTIPKPTTLFGKEIAIGSRLLDADTGILYCYEGGGEYAIIASGGSGGDTPMPVMGVDETTTAFPTQRPGGEPLVNGDYVYVKPSATLPFTIDDVEFQSKKDRAVYLGGEWQLNATAFQNTSETPLTNKILESLTGEALMQSEANIELVNRIKAMKAVVEVETLPTTNIKLDTIYHLTEDITDYLAGFYYYNETDWVLIVPENILPKVDNDTIELDANEKLRVKDEGIHKDKIDPEAKVVYEEDEQTLTNKTINADNNEISELETNNLKNGVLDTDIDSTSTDAQLPSSKAVYDYIEAKESKDLKLTDSATESLSGISTNQSETNNELVAKIKSMKSVVEVETLPAADIKLDTIYHLTEDITGFKAGFYYYNMSAWVLIVQENIKCFRGNISSIEDLPDDIKAGQWFRLTAELVPQEITNLREKVWVGNDSLTLILDAQADEVSFSSVADPTLTWQRMRHNYTNSLIYENSTHDRTPVYRADETTGEYGWIDAKYQKIKFIDGDDVEDADFISWLKNNGKFTSENHISAPAGACIVAQKDNPDPYADDENWSILHTEENPEVAFDDVTIGVNEDGELEVKNSSLEMSKINSSMKATSITSASTDDKFSTAKSVYDVVKIAGHTLTATIDTTTYIMTLTLKDKEDNVLSTQTIDLPLESLVLNVEYVNTTEHPKSLKITLQSGNVIYVPLADIIDGLENTSNKVISITSSSTDIQYPSAKATWTLSETKVDKTTKVNGHVLSGDVTVTKSDVGLSNVDNTSDATKKTNFTGSIFSGNTGFITGGDAYTALAGKASTAVATTFADGLMSSTDKTKLDGIETGANKTVVDELMSSTSTNPLQNKVIKAALDNKASTDIATTSANGLMSSTDKSKLDSIEAQANKTVVDTALSSSSTNPVQNKVINTALASKAGTATATTSANGLMSSADKTKLDGVETGANKTTVDTALSSSSTNPVQNKVINTALISKEDTTNKVTTISSTATDTQYPSAKAIYNYARPVPTTKTFTGYDATFVLTQNNFTIKNNYTKLVFEDDGVSENIFVLLSLGFYHSTNLSAGGISAGVLKVNGVTFEPLSATYTGAFCNKGNFTVAFNPDNCYLNVLSTVTGGSGTDMVFTVPAYVPRTNMRAMGLVD